MKNFKITKIDIVLFVEFIFCCVAVLYLSWYIG